MKKTLTTLTLLLGLTLCASAQNYQTNYWYGSRGLFERGMSPDNNEFSNSRGMINSNTGSGNGITNDDFNATPLGSGLLILVGAGLGYVALKKKEDEQ